MNTAMTTQNQLGNRPEERTASEGEVVSLSTSISPLSKKIEEIVESMGLFEHEKKELVWAVQTVLTGEITESNGWVKILSIYISTSPMRKISGLEKKIRYVLAKLFNSPFKFDYQNRHHIVLYIKTNNEVIKLLKGEEI